MSATLPPLPRRQGYNGLRSEAGATRGPTSPSPWPWLERMAGKPFQAADELGADLAADPFVRDMGLAPSVVQAATPAPPVPPASIPVSSYAGSPEIRPGFSGHFDPSVFNPLQGAPSPVQQLFQRSDDSSVRDAPPSEEEQYRRRAREAGGPISDEEREAFKQSRKPVERNTKFKATEVANGPLDAGGGYAHGGMMYEGLMPDRSVPSKVQFAEDDARRPQQVAQQAYELQQKGLREHDEDRARQMEIAALKQQAEQQRAAAIMQFEQTYGVPYSDASAPHIIQAAYEQQKDSDYEKQAAQYAQYLGMGSMPGPDGRVRPFTRADYDAAMLTLQFKMGSDKKSPGEFFRALVDRQAAADLEREAAATRQPPR